MHLRQQPDGFSHLFSFSRCLVCVEQGLLGRGFWGTFNKIIDNGLFSPPTSLAINVLFNWHSQLQSPEAKSLCDSHDNGSYLIIINLARNTSLPLPQPPAPSSLAATVAAVIQPLRSPSQGFEVMSVNVCLNDD